MSSANWQEVLGWNQGQINELRYAGFSFLMEGQYGKAVTLFEALTVLEPNDPYDIQTLGALYLQMSRDAEALPLLERALEIDPSHEPTQLNKVKALLATGASQEAISLAKRLSKSTDPLIANDAQALLLAYR